MLIYIAGPMSGIKDFNYPEFNKAAERLRNLGYDVINPAEIKLTPEFQQKAGDKNSKEYEQLVRMGEFHSMFADIVLMLDGWMHSDGAIRELRACDISHNAIAYNYCVFDKLCNVCGPLRDKDLSDLKKIKLFLNCLLTNRKRLYTINKGKHEASRK
jgi:hypothetical protein